ncbi:MAG: hypothetical protein ABIO65_01955 [Nitrospiria bacterium]
MNSPIARFSACLTLFAVIGLTALVLSPRAEAGTPCCEITSIDAKTGLVTVKEIATGATFQFKADSDKLRKSFKVGQTLDTKAIANSSRAGALGGRPFCKCGKRTDGTCWCVNKLGDLCHNPLCPSLPRVGGDTPSVESSGGVGE